MLEVPAQDAIHLVYHGNRDMVCIFEITLRNCAITNIFVCQPFNVIGQWECRELQCHLFHLAQEHRIWSSFDLSGCDLGDEWIEAFDFVEKRFCKRFPFWISSSNRAEITEVSRYIFSFRFMFVCLFGWCGVLNAFEAIYALLSDGTSE